MSVPRTQSRPPFFERLQALAAKRVTGVLRIALPGRGVVLHVDAGRVVRAEEAGRGASIEFVDLVVKRGLVSVAQLNRLLDRHLGEEPGRVLRKAGVLDSTTVAELRALQVERVFERLSATVPDEVVVDKDVAVVGQPGLDPLLLSDLVAKLRRRAEQWPRLIERIGAREVGLRPLTEDEDALGRLGPDERRLMDQIGAAATVGELLGRSPWCDFDTLRGLCQLVDRGVVGLVGGPESVEEAGGLSPERRESIRRRRRGHQLTTIALVVIAAAVLLTAITRWMPTSHAPVDVRWARLQRGLARRTEARLHRAVAVYRLREEGLPGDLGALVGGHYVSEGDLRHPRLKSPFFYRREGEASYQLLPPYR